MRSDMSDKPIEIVEIEKTLGQYGVECSSGWYDLIIQCHKELLAIDPNYVPVQIKEKFGGLRFYFDTSETDDRIEMHRIVSKYEKLSYTICEVSGRQGAQLMRYKTRGHVRTLHPDIAGEDYSPCDENFNVY